jgi:hypothetical protein
VVFNQPHIQAALGSLSSAAKRPRRDDHEVMNEWSYTSSPSICPRGVCNDNFTSYPCLYLRSGLFPSGFRTTFCLHVSHLRLLYAPLSASWYGLSIPQPKCLGPECLGFRIFSNFGVLVCYNEIAWVWDPNLNAKSIYGSYTAYACIGFIRL